MARGSQNKWRGTRKTCVPKTANANVLLEEGKTLFFPDGVSRKGVQASACTFDIRDFSHCPLSDDDTVGSLYEVVRMSGILGFFLYSTGPNVTKDETSGTQEDNESPRSSSTLSVQEKSAEPPVVYAHITKSGPRTKTASGAGPKPCTVSRPDQEEIPIQLPRPATFVCSDEGSVPPAEVILEVGNFDIEDEDITFGPRLSTDSNLTDTLPLEDQGDPLTVPPADAPRYDDMFEALPHSSPRSPTPPPALQEKLTYNFESSDRATGNDFKIL